MGFDFSQCGAVNAEGQTPYLEEGEYLVRLVECKFGPSQKDARVTNLSQTVEIVVSGNARVQVGQRRKMVQTDKGDYGPKFLAVAIKQLACALHGFSVNDPKLNVADSDTAGKERVGQALESTLKEACQGLLNGVEFRVIARPAVSKGVVVRAKSGEVMHNYVVERAEKGWTPATVAYETFAAPPPAPAAAPPPAALPSTQGVAAPWDPQPAAAPAPQAAPPAPPAAGGDFWGR